MVYFCNVAVTGFPIWSNSGEDDAFGLTVPGLAILMGKAWRGNSRVCGDTTPSIGWGSRGLVWKTEAIVPFLPTPRNPLLLAGPQPQQLETYHSNTGGGGCQFTFKLQYIPSESSQAQRPHIVWFQCFKIRIATPIETESLGVSRSSGKKELGSDCF